LHNSPLSFSKSDYPNILLFLSYRSPKIVEKIIYQRVNQYKFKKELKIFLADLNRFDYSKLYSFIASFFWGLKKHFFRASGFRGELVGQ